MVLSDLSLVMEISLRFDLVVLPDSRELKWSWPALRCMTFLFLVILNLFTVALCVLIFGIYVFMYGVENFFVRQLAEVFKGPLNKKQVKYLVFVFTVIVCLSILY